MSLSGAFMGVVCVLVALVWKFFVVLFIILTTLAVARDTRSPLDQRFSRCQSLRTLRVDTPKINIV